MDKRIEGDPVAAAHAERVRQLANAGRLQEVPWEGRSKAFTRSSVVALAARKRPGGRPPKG